MSRATQISDRKRIEAFLREMFRGEPGLDGGALDALAQRCSRRIKRVVVWDEATAPDAHDTETEPAHAEAADSPSAPPAAAIGSDAAQPEHASAATIDAQETAASPGPIAFDPYAFSAVVVLTKTGKDGLLKRLAAIDRAEHLKKLADAQHLAVDASLSSIADLRAAIVKAAEQRIANRRAAAS